MTSTMVWRSSGAFWPRRLRAYRPPRPRRRFAAKRLHGLGVQLGDAPFGGVVVGGGGGEFLVALAAERRQRRGRGADPRAGGQAGAHRLDPGRGPPGPDVGDLVQQPGGGGPGRGGHHERGQGIHHHDSGGLDCGPGVLADGGPSTPPHRVQVEVFIYAQPRGRLVGCPACGCFVIVGAPPGLPMLGCWFVRPAGGGVEGRGTSSHRRER